MMRLYPIYENNKLWIDLIVDKNWRKYIDWFGRYWLLINFNTEKYWIWQKEYKNSDPFMILKRFGISENDKNNINGLTVWEAMQKGIKYINWEIKHL